MISINKYCSFLPEPLKNNAINFKENISLKKIAQIGFTIFCVLGAVYISHSQKTQLAPITDTHLRNQGLLSGPVLWQQMQTSQTSCLPIEGNHLKTLESELLKNQKAQELVDLALNKYKFCHANEDLEDRRTWTTKLSKWWDGEYFYQTHKQQLINEVISKHEDQLLNIYLEKERFGPISGVKAYPSHHLVFELEEAPNFIFKIARRDSTEMKTQYEKSLQAKELCKQKNFKYLKVPESHLVTQLNGKEVEILVQEKLPVITKTAEFYHQMDLINQNPELRDELGLAIAELGEFIGTTSLYDVKARNTPLLKNGIGFGLVDLGMHDDGHRGFYSTLEYNNLVGLVREPHKELVKNLAKKHAKNFQEEKFDKIENKHSEILKHYREVQDWRKRNEIEDATLLSHEKAFLKKLSQEDQKIAGCMIDKINEAIINQTFNYEWRTATVKTQDCYDYKYEETKMLDDFVKNRLIHSYKNQGGHGYLYYL